MATVPNNPLGVQVHCRVTFPQPVTTTYRLRCVNPPGGVHCRFQPTEAPFPELLPYTGTVGVLVHIRGVLPRHDFSVSIGLAEAATVVTTTTVTVRMTGTSPVDTSQAALADMRLLAGTPAALRPTAVEAPLDTNGVLEPGEQIRVQTTWYNPQATTVTVTGALTTPEGDLNIVDGQADFGDITPATERSCAATGDCYTVVLATPTTRPALHWDVSVLETLSTGAARTWVLHVGESFADVPMTAPYYREIETILHHGITAGCGNGNFCPDNNISRGQLLIFLGRALVTRGAWIPGRAYIPEAGKGHYRCTPGGVSLYADIAPEHVLCPYAHYLDLHEVAAPGTHGCDPGRFCPGRAVPRKLLAHWLAAAMRWGEDQVPAVYTDPGTGRHYNCEQGTTYFADVGPNHPDCKFIHYLWARGVVEDGEFGCGGGTFCPNDWVDRRQAAVYIRRAFGLTLWTREAVTCPERTWSWGQYDWFAQNLPDDATALENFIAELRNDGFRGFRTFVQGFFSSQGGPPGLQPYPRDASGRFDVHRWNRAYWSDVRRAVDAMKAQGYDRIVFSLGHNYLKYCNGQCCQNEHLEQPWENNTDNVNLCTKAGQPCRGGGLCRWMNGWNRLATEDCAGVNCQQWVKQRYKALARQLYAIAGDALVLEIYNEADVTSGDVRDAHDALINMFRADPELQNVRIQVNFHRFAEDCPDLRDDHQTAWDRFGDRVDYWAIHGIEMECVDGFLEQNLFKQILNTGKLEISTDGQHCLDRGTISRCCKCCHLNAGELLDDLLHRATDGNAPQSAKFSFEHGVSVFHTQHVAEPNRLDWSQWEAKEIRCLYRDLCGGGCTWTDRGRLWGRRGSGAFARQKVVVNDGDAVDLFWNSTFERTEHRLQCVLRRGGTTVETATHKCLRNQTAACGTARYRLVCNGTQQDLLEVTTCGNGTCDGCENEQNCPDDCRQCNYDGACDWDKGENRQNCIDCARTDIQGRPPGGSRCGDADFTVQPDQTYTICWDIDAPATSDCTIVRRVNDNPFADWKDPDVLGRQASATDRIVSLPDMCQVDGDCGDPNLYDCVTETKVETREYNARCSEGGVTREDRDPIIVTASYTRKKCVRTGQ